MNNLYDPHADRKRFLLLLFLLYFHVFAFHSAIYAIAGWMVVGMYIHGAMMERKKYIALLVVCNHYTKGDTIDTLLLCGRTRLRVCVPVAAA